MGWGSLPGEETAVDLAATSIWAESVEGVDWIEMCLYPPNLRPAIKCAGYAHFRGWQASRCKLVVGIRGILAMGASRGLKQLQGNECSLK